MPKIAAEMAQSVVITGLRMNGSDKFIAKARSSFSLLRAWGWRRHPAGRRRGRLIRDRCHRLPVVQTELAEWFGQYRRLMAHWHSVMPGRVLDVHYDALVADPEAVMRGVLHFCGLPWDAAATSLDGRGAVATASSPQMRGGIIKNRSAAWAPYEAQLQPLINGLSGLV